MGQTLICLRFLASLESVGSFPWSKSGRSDTAEDVTGTFSMAANSQAAGRLPLRWTQTSILPKKRTHMQRKKQMFTCTKKSVYETYFSHSYRDRDI